MNRTRGLIALFVVVAAVSFAYNRASRLWAAGKDRRRSVITERIDETRLITLKGNTRREAKIPENDRGRVADDAGSLSRPRGPG